MKHILIYSDCAGIHGAEQVNHSLAMAFSAAGYRVSFAQPSANHHLIHERESQGIVHHWLPLEQLYELSVDAPSLSDAGPAARVFTSSVPDLVLFADGCPLSSLAAKMYCGENGISFFVLVHCVFEGWQQDYASYLETLARCYQQAEDVVAVSADNLQLLRSVFSLSPTKGRVIHNGRPTGYFSPIDAARREQLRQDLGLAPDSVLCLSIGRMELVKGFQYQLDAIGRMVDQPGWPLLHFLWVGSGTQQKQLLGVARLLARDKFTHFEEHADIPQLMGIADILIHTARFEGMPLVVLEAMAQGLPVVATSVSGIPEALADTGVLLPPPQASANLPQTIADAVCSLADDAPTRSRLGQAARHRAQSMFQEEDMLQHYLELVEKLMAGSR